MSYFIHLSLSGIKMTTRLLFIHTASCTAWRKSKFLNRVFMIRNNILPVRMKDMKQPEKIPLRNVNTILLKGMFSPFRQSPYCMLHICTLMWEFYEDSAVWSYFIVLYFTILHVWVHNYTYIAFDAYMSRHKKWLITVGTFTQVLF